LRRHDAQASTARSPAQRAKIERIVALNRRSFAGALKWFLVERIART